VQLLPFGRSELECYNHCLDFVVFCFCLKGPFFALNSSSGSVYKYHNLYQIITHKKITNTTVYLLCSTMLCVSVLYIKPCTSIFQPPVQWVLGLSWG